MSIISNWNITHKDRACFQIDKLQLERGLSYHLSGKNGTGKTTFLKRLCGFEDKGIVAAEKCGYFNFSEFDLLPFLTVSENLAFFYQNLNQYDCSFIEWTKNIPLYHKLKDQKVKEISTGEKQVFKFYLILTIDKKIFCLDEVFTHLDQEHSEFICQKLEAEKKERIIISSSQEMLMSADRNLIINDGRLDVLKKEDQK